MSENETDLDSTSKTNLIEVQHVGVTAKLQTPLKNILPSDKDASTVLFYNKSHNKYNKLSYSSQMDTETESSRILYEMRTNHRQKRKVHTRRVTPSKIEFQLYRKNGRTLRRKSAPNLQRREHKKEENLKKDKSNFLQRMQQSFSNMCASKPQTDIYNEAEVTTQKAQNCFIFDEPKVKTSATQTVPGDTRIGIYHFEHGCAEYLRTTDSHPQIVSVVLADRATQYATRFWAEFFGSLHICVAFIVTFLLQTYRFMLYSLINTVIVGFLLMTSDYLIKPLLAVSFNGFVQPICILLFNILTSLRDLLEPISDAINNFMKPLATLGNSVRLINVNYSYRKTAKDV